MRTFLHFSLLIVFCLWLIPLGQFISQNRQDEVCGGQRAICMCYAKAPMKSSTSPFKFTTNQGSSNQKEVPSSGAGGNHYVQIATVPLIMNSSAVYPDPIASLPSLLFIRGIEHVPKV